MSLYQVTLYTPNPLDRAFNISQTRIVGSLTSARLLAASLLKPHARHETSYSARVTRAPYVMVISVDRLSKFNVYWPTGRHNETIEPSLTYVSSVGDLGYGA